MQFFYAEFAKAAQCVEDCQSVIRQKFTRAFLPADEVGVAISDYCNTHGHPSLELGRAAGRKELSQFTTSVKHRVVKPLESAPWQEPCDKLLEPLRQ